MEKGANTRPHGNESLSGASKTPLACMSNWLTGMHKLSVHLALIFVTARLCACRRMKTELLIQMDGVRGAKANEQVFVMAASNLPWDLDIAVLRRLEKRVLVPLPEAAAREAMIRKHLSSRASGAFNYEDIARQTEGYSGADLELLCREAAMMPVRRLMSQLQQLDMTAGASAGAIPDPPPSKHGRNIKGGYGGASVPPVDVQALLLADPVTDIDIGAALASTRPSSDGKMTKYEAWQREFGSV
jgi:katanin p60 ATPase-containing subunit A1